MKPLIKVPFIEKIGSALSTESAAGVVLIRGNELIVRLESVYKTLVFPSKTARFTSHDRIYLLF